MKRITALIAAAVLALTATAATSKVATQAWVMKQLAASGNRVFETTVTTNAAGKITYKSPVYFADLPQCSAISLTVSGVTNSTHVTWITPTPTILDLILFRAYAAYPGKVTGDVSIVIESGAWYEHDAAGNEFAHPFNLEGGVTLTSEIELPDMPSTTHTCDIGDDCNCKGAGLTADDVEYPEDLELWNAKKGVEELGEWEKWVDKDSLPNGFWKRTRNGVTSYYIKDNDGISINLDNLQQSSAWASAILSTMTEINNYLKECREAYATAAICTKTNPQHDWETKTCGTSNAKVCKRNASHKDGTITHQFPGSTFSAGFHACKCGAMTEPHGTLVAGTQTETSTGFTIVMSCPKGCGFTQTYTHTHKFTNCGTCTAGDGCTKVCTGCNGQHVKVAATSSECAKCGCTVCTDCTWHPSGDMADHAGWEPCGEDTEGDNDSLEARGSHCRCQCRKYGHVARTPHEYEAEEGEQRYEDVTNAQHYKILGKCTRCDQFKKKLEEHDFPEDPTMYVYRSEDFCKWVYRCKSNGCEHDKVEDEHAHSWDDSAAVRVNHSASVCRKRTQCKNCKGWKTDDSEGHERDAENGCKCKNGCGYQFAHSYAADSCGNQACTYCKAYQSEGDKTHAAWTDLDETNHRCGCQKTTAAHTFTDWIKLSADPNIIHYKRTCTACPRLESKDEPCTHATWGDWVEIGRGAGAVTYQATCTVCGASKTKVEPIPAASACDTQNDIHYAATDACGCICGKYGENGIASSDVNFHKWADTTNADGIKICVCKCGKFHAKRDPTAYLINARRACTAVCAYCKTKGGSGIGITAAAEDEHTPCETQDGRCGCLCGKLTADNTKVAKFHIQKPGTCRCFGANGNGGSWHFPEPRTDCTKICQYLINGQKHLAATQKEDGGITVAHPRHHTKTDANACGCKCGTYTGSNYSTWEGENFHNSKPYYCGCYCKHGSESQVPNYHKKLLDTDCDCQCGAKLVSHVAPTAPECKCQGKCRVDGPKHFPVCTDGKCPGVCHGNCRESKEESKRGKHSPEGSTRCGCQCNELGAEGFTADAFHTPRGTPSCWCAGHHYHTHTAKDGCHELCAYCNQITASDRKSTYAAADSDHTFLASKCVCECDDEIERDHIYGNRQSSAAGTETCETCGQTITNYIDTWTCKRCGDVQTGGHQEGHDPTCGQKHAGDSGQLSWCEKHNINYSGTECPECAKESEDNNGGNIGGGNSGNQSGEPDDIL